MKLHDLTLSSSALDVAGHKGSAAVPAVLGDRSRRQDLGQTKIPLNLSRQETPNSVCEV